MLQSAWLSKGRTEERVSVAAQLGRGVGRHPSALRLPGEATSAAGSGRAPGRRSPGRRPPGCRASLDELGGFAAGYRQPALGVGGSADWLRRRRLKGFRSGGRAGGPQRAPGTAGRGRARQEAGPRVRPGRRLSFPTDPPFWSLWVLGSRYRAGDGRISGSIYSRLTFSTSSVLQSAFRCSVLAVAGQGRGAPPGRF